MRWLVCFLLMMSATIAQAAPCPTFPGGYITAPCTITTNGDYVLGGDLVVSSMPPWSGYSYETPIIEVVAGVTQALINCNRFYITHNGNAYAAEGIGVGGRQNANITVLGCAFKGTGMMMCANFDNAINWAYANIDIYDNDCSATWQGFFVQSHGARIVRNIISNIGGHANCNVGTYTYGIQLYGGYSARGAAWIKENRVRGLWNKCRNEVVGISLSGYGQQVEITDNEVQNFVVVNTASMGMWFGWLSGPIIYSGNKIDTWYKGYNSGYVPLYGPAVLSGASLITNTTTPVYGFDPPPVGIWTITP